MSQFPFFIIYTVVLWIALAAIIFHHHYKEYFRGATGSSSDLDRGKHDFKIETSNKQILNGFTSKIGSISNSFDAIHHEDNLENLPPRPRDVIDNINRKGEKPETELNVGLIEKSTLKYELKTNSSFSERMNPFVAPRIRDKSYYRSKGVDGQGVPWKDFIGMDIEIPKKNPINVNEVNLTDLQIHFCSDSQVAALTTPALSEADFKWCQWALSKEGGNVQVGKSYGSLNGPDRNKYEQLSCNTVAQGKNPSCDDAWGDEFIKSWKRNTVDNLCGDENIYTSKLHCMDSSSTARFCAFENVLFDFSKMFRAPRPGRSDSRRWDRGFLSSHCSSDKSDINFYQFYGPTVNPATTKCDYIFNETVLAYSHDDIKNLGHSMSDIMNVWAMLWMSGMGSFSKDITFFNIDALRMGHSYDDELSQFARHYEVSFARIIKAVDLADQQHGAGSGATVCFKRLIFQPIPLVLFTWDGWWQEMKCSFVGASSMFQRWNLHIRLNYGLLGQEGSSMLPTNQRFQILLVVRRLAGDHSSMYTSRIFANEPDIVRALQSLSPQVRLVVQDLAVLSFEQQIKLIASSSLLIGMHGAGIANSMHMAVGSLHCCGVIEIFPQGEFSQIRGYGNMARRMGHHYEMMQLGGGGSRVDPSELLKAVERVSNKIHKTPTCVLPTALSDPYFDSVKGGFT